jgi:tetratricopeptide (TPR) repeat protein
LGNIHLEEKNYDEAIKTYNRAIQINPGYAAAFTNRGNVYSRNGEPEKAIADYTEAIRLKPDNVIPLINRSWSYGEIGEYDRAEWDEEEAVRLQPDLKSVLLYVKGGMCFFPMSILEDDKGREEVNEAIRALTTAINLRPNNATLINNRAQNYSVLGEYDKAIADWTEAIRLNLDKAVHCKTFYRDRAQNYSVLGEYDKAIADWTEAIRLNLDKAVHCETFYQDRGDAYSKKGDYEKAIADYTEIIRLEPENSGVYRKRGDAYKALGQHDKATLDHEKANQLEQWKYLDMETFVDFVGDIDEEDISEIFDENIDTGQPEKLAEAYLKESSRWFSNDDEQQGKKFLAKALDIYSGMNEEKAKQLKSVFLPAHVVDNVRKLDNEIARISDVIHKQLEKTAYFLNNRGIACAEKAAYGKALMKLTGILEMEASVGKWFDYQADYNRAIADFTEAIALKEKAGGSDEVFYQNRGKLYVDLKQYENAIADFTKVIRCSCHPGDYLYCRGIVHDDKGDYGKAIADYTESIKSEQPFGCYHAESFYNRGLIYDKMEEYEKAVSDYTAAIWLVPKGSPVAVSALRNRSLVYKTIGQPDKTEADLLRLRSISIDKDYEEITTRCPRKGISFTKTMFM